MIPIYSTILTTTHKTYYYNFLPSKEEEEVLKNYTHANPNPQKPTRALIEIRDLVAPPTMNPNEPWKIKKRLTWLDLRDGRLTLTHDEAFNHVFRYWSLSLTSLVVFGPNKLAMAIWDHSDYWVAPKKYVGHNIYFERGPNDTFFLGWLDVFHAFVVFHPGDEIGLFWDADFRAFRIKLLSCQT